VDSFTIGILGTVAMVALVFAGVRVFYAAAAVGLVGLVSMIGWDAGAGMPPLRNPARTSPPRPPDARP
jgi:hypothetical protein